MLPVFTSEEMRSCDKAAVDRYGIPGLLLMENASRGAADAVEEYFGPVGDTSIIILCGKGNNGGDGFAMARHLVNRGARVDVMMLGADADSKGEASVNLGALRKMEEDSDELRVFQLSDTAVLEDMLEAVPDLVVDAMLGTGLASDVKGQIADIIDLLNNSGIPVFAVDIPTGINAETGEVMGAAVRAFATATMGGLKRGLLLGDGHEYSGIVQIVDISMPVHGFAETATQTFLLEESDVYDGLPPRTFDAHKYQVGSVFLLAGSTGLTGAAAMSAEAALRSGAGIVKLGIPRGLNTILESKLTEVMTVPFSETDEGSLNLHDQDAILEHINAATVGVIGPGISRHFETQQLILRIIENATVPLLIDADGLFALTGHLDLLREAKNGIILTPHVGEFARLIDRDKSEIENNRIDIAREFAIDYGVTLVLKGAPTVIAAADWTVYINPTGNPGMATAGTGDVLSGMIAGLWAQSLSSAGDDDERSAAAIDAACTGVYLHGLAGDRAEEESGQFSLLAGDLLHGIAPVLKEFTQTD